MNSLNDQVIRAYQTDIIEMMEEHFGERYSIIEDPETGEETLLKVNGGDISESEFYALTYFEIGWSKCLKSIETMGNSILYDAIEDAYYREDDDDESDTRRTG
jgi:hypothetical protein